MGFGLWIDERERVAWAGGTHEYRPMGAAVIAITDQFRPRDFSRFRDPPSNIRDSFAGFFGSLEEVNEYLRLVRFEPSRLRLRPTPSQVH